MLSRASPPHLLVAALGLLLVTGCSDDPPGPLPDTSSAGGSGGDGGGGASPVGPGAVIPCPPGQLELDDDGSCLPPGMAPEDCGEGFEHDGDRSCLPVLPDAPCGLGEMAVPGDSSCRPVSPCGAGKWGSIPVAGSTQYVDGGYQGTSTGSELQPWTTVQEGVDAAAAGAIVAVAAGSYGESVLVEHSLTLWGACPSDVSIVGSAGASGVSISEDVSSVAIRDLAITGSGSGVWSHGAASVVIERVWVHDTAEFGILGSQSGEASLVEVRDSLVEQVRGGGIHAAGADLLIHRSVVRNTLPVQGYSHGVGVNRTEGSRGSVTVRQSLVEGASGRGVYDGGADLLVEDSVVRDISPRQNGGDGQGIGGAPLDDEWPQLTVRGSLIETSHFGGICVDDGDLVVERTLVRDIEPHMLDGYLGTGIRLVGEEPSMPLRPTGRIERTVVERTHDMGIRIIGSEAELMAVVVRDIMARAVDGERGRGISINYGVLASRQRSEVRVRGCRVERTRESGILTAGADVEIDSCAIFDVLGREVDDMAGVGIVALPEVRDWSLSQRSVTSVRRCVVERARAGGIGVAVSDLEVSDVVVRESLGHDALGDFGDGISASSTVVIISAHYPTSLDIIRATVEQSARAGVSNFAADVTIADSLLDCNTIDLDGEQDANSPPFTFESLGGNWCGCGDEARECAVLSSGLSAPSAAW